MYTEKVMNHFENPRNMGVVQDFNAEGTVGNPRCGDIMKITMRIDDNIVTDIKFKTFGCTAAVATSSVSTEMVKGKTIQEALQLTNKAVVEELEGLPPQKIHCSVLAEEAIKAAIKNYFQTQGIDEKSVLGYEIEIEESDHELVHGN